jgi:hypothetical protein
MCLGYKFSHEYTVMRDDNRAQSAALLATLCVVDFA